MSTSVIDNRVEVVFSFDTTGSMYPCLAQVRKKLGSAVARLTKEIPGIRIGIIAHGDYCDERSTYVTKALDLTDDAKAIARFVEKVEQTGGGDAPECYELVLHQAQSLSVKSRIVCSRFGGGTGEESSLAASFSGAWV
ncbi:vWA domain-containing protein [Citreicoccus inhibens]|uniref:vWA domain-containing protein n=1 Tax=Citreicoccus inhibens TaxID=2849499 RepID=UPI001F4798E2|nr:VWA domain-containing protein [Citreicoccus inhibens]